MDALELLMSRTSAVRLTDPAPTPETLKVILEAAVRAPDHGRLCPWRMVVIEGEARKTLAGAMVAALREKNPDSSSELLEREGAKALRAPLIVAVAARVRSNIKIPEIEQLFAVAAAAQNIMLAVHALGFGAMWKTGDAAYDEGVKVTIGLEPTDAVIGFIYIGTRGAERVREGRVSVQDYVSSLSA
jgi:nitroreductase